MLEINILKPRAAKLLQELADQKLISIRRPATNGFRNVVARLRKKAAAAPPTLDEITAEVEKVRAKRYAKRKAPTGRLYQSLD